VRSRSSEFDELVLDAVDRLRPRWDTQLAEVDVVVAEVPPDPLAVDPAGDWLDLSRTVPLGAAVPASPGARGRVVVHRRPVMARAEGRRALRLLVHDVVVEQLAALLGRAPHEIDPGYLGPDEH
jgi:predicted Zn-dependent protease with MMP-like domain